VVSPFLKCDGMWKRAGLMRVDWCYCYDLRLSWYLVLDD
jgi:hypothetical protein